MPFSPGSGSVGALGPIQPFEFATPQPLSQPPTITFEEDSNDWWSGVQNCFVQVAIATTIAATALTTYLAQPNFDPQEMPPLAQEETWQHQIQQPVQWFIPQFASSVAAAPAPIPPHEPDEDFWINPVRAVAAYPVPIVFRADDEVGHIVDEDFWQHRVAPSAQWTIPLYGSSVAAAPAPVAAHQPDEDYWQNPVAPIASYPVPFVSRSDEEIELVTGKPDEDYWQHAIRQSPSWFIPQFASSVAAAPAPIPPHVTDEDYWQHQITSSPLWTAPLYRSSVAAAPPPTSPIVDENYWQNRVAPVVASNFLRFPYLPDPDDLKVSPVAPGQPDDDTWQHRVQPPFNWLVPKFSSSQAAAPAPSILSTPDEDFYQPQLIPEPLVQFIFFMEDGSDVAGFQPNEDYWNNPVKPAFTYPLPIVFNSETVEIFTPLSISFDEDFWQNPVAPVVWPNGRLYLPDPEELKVAAQTPGEPDEDFWQNPVRPVSGTNYIRLPYLPDPEELTLSVPPNQIDEDFWQHRMQPPQQWNVPLFASSMAAAPAPPPFRLDDDPYQPQLIPEPLVQFIFFMEDGSDVAGFQPNEDYWANPVEPVVAANVISLPHLPDADEVIPSTTLQPDEDYWQNPVAPVAAYPVPIVFRADDEIESFIVEEEFWINPVRAVASYAPPRYFVDDDTWPTPPPPVSFLDEDFWQNPVAPVVWPNGRLYMPDPQGRHFILPFTVRGSGTIQVVRGTGQITSVDGTGEIE